MRVFHRRRSSGCLGYSDGSCLRGRAAGIGSVKRRSLKTVIELVLILGLLHGRHETKWVNRSQDNTRVFAGSSRILICSEESWSSAVPGFLFPSFSRVWPRE